MAILLERVSTLILHHLLAVGWLETRSGGEWES